MEIQTDSCVCIVNLKRGGFVLVLYLSSLSGAIAERGAGQPTFEVEMFVGTPDDVM